MQRVTVTRTTKDLQIELLPGVDRVEIVDLLDDLFWDDIYLEMFESEWSYLTHENTNIVYMVDDYHRDGFRELNSRGKTTIPASDLSYREYLDDMNN